MFGMIWIPHHGRIAAQLARAGDLLWEVVFWGSTRGHASSRSELDVHRQRMPIKDPAVLERHLAALRKTGLK